MCLFADVVQLEERRLAKAEACRIVPDHLLQRLLSSIGRATVS